MKNISEYYNSLEDIVEMSEEQQNRLYSSLRDCAALDASTFIDFIHSIPLEESNYLFYVYEALAANASNWEHFILDEIERIFTLAEKSSSSSQILEPLEALAFYEESSFVQEICKALSRRLTSPNISIRRRAVWILGNLISDSQNIYVGQFKNILLNDSDWRTRNFARYTLEEVNALPMDYHQPFLDVIRRKIFNEFIR